MLRIPIERLARYLADEDLDQTLKQLAVKYDTTTGRIQDAADVLKIRRGEATTIPPVEWDD
jgi:hypothetical protein